MTAKPKPIPPAQQRLIIELATGGCPDIVQERPSGTAQFIAWNRVADAFRHFGAVRDNEYITHVIVSDTGVELFFARFHHQRSTNDHHRRTTGIQRTASRARARASTS